MIRFRHALWVLICLYPFFPLHSQVPDTCLLEIGTNLAGPSDYGSEWPLKNIMKYSRSWITQNNVWVGGGENAWDTQVLDSIPQDSNGYPLKLPYDVPGTEAPQMVLTVWANTEALPAGRYVVLYEGIGIIDMDFDATVVSSTPGRLTFDLDPGASDIMALIIRESREGDHIRNIRVLLPGTENSYQNDPWTPQWVEKLEVFNTLRFMDWGYTNNSRLVEWSDRPMVSDYTYTLDGMPYEWMIRVCNDFQKNAWVCIPHAANDEYIRTMAEMFRDELDPDLTIYVEYSNEIWNWIFEQTHYCNNQGDQDVPWPERTVPFIQHALDIWTDAFAGQTDRLVRFVGVQGAWQDVSNRVVFNMQPGSFDAFGPAAYFGFNDSAYMALESLGAAATADHVLFWAEKSMLGESLSWLESQKTTIADSLDIPMLFYEGGQHLTPSPFGTEQPYNPALVAAQQDPRMYDLYNTWLDTIRSMAIENQTPMLFMNFSFMGPFSGRYGSWGVLQHQFNQNPPYQDAPKYRALLDNIYDCGVTTSVFSPKAASSWTLYPNPAGQTLFFESELEGDLILECYSVLGQKLDQWSLATFSRNKVYVTQEPGLYFFVLRDTGGQTFGQKAVILVE